MRQVTGAATDGEGGNADPGIDGAAVLLPPTSCRTGLFDPDRPAFRGQCEPEQTMSSSDPADLVLRFRS